MIMKKILTLIVMAVALATPSHAQLKFGLQGGINQTSMSDFSFDQAGVEDAVENKSGFFVGPTVKYTFPLIGLGFDIAALYDQREAKDGDQTLKSKSVQIPVNVRYGIGLGDVAEFFAFAGPQFGFNIGDKTQTWEDVQGYSRDWTMKTSSLSANVGIGATVLNHLQVKANYNIALGKTGDIEVKDATNAAWDVVKGDAKANAWQISLTYFF